MKKLSITLKSLVAVCAIVGVCLQVFPEGLRKVNGAAFLYFTIQSNIWIALVCLAGLVMMLKDRKPGKAWSVVKLMFTISITLTGMVFCFMLAPTMKGNAFTPDSVLVHVCSPLLAVIDFFVCSRYYSLKKSDAAWVLLPPLYYLAFASVGFVCNWSFAGGVNYPYFFLNWGSPLGAFGFSSSFPFIGSAWYCIALLIALWTFGLAYIAIARAVRRHAPEALA